MCFKCFAKIGKLLGIWRCGSSQQLLFNEREGVDSNYPTQQFSNVRTGIPSNVRTGNHQRTGIPFLA